jgi:peptide/nickel transport system permease protein
MALFSHRPLLRGTRRPVLAKVQGFDRIIFTVTALILLVAIFGPLVAPSSVYQSNILGSLGHPSLSHLFGTDEQGRDVFWRVVAGARYSVLSAMLIVAGYSVIGVVVATLATIGGRYVDEVVMRVTDAGLALPPIIFALSLAAVLGPSLRSAIIALIATGWPFTARLLRGIMRETMETPFVEGAMVLGMSRRRLLLRHVLPNSLDVLIVKWAGDVGNTILVLAGLSFVGVGAQPPSPEWGAMVTDAQGYISSAWWATVAPGVAVALTAATFGLLGDLLQVRLNPNLGGEEPSLVAQAAVRPEEIVLT